MPVMDTETPIAIPSAPRKRRTKLYVLAAAAVVLVGAGTALGLILTGSGSAASGDPKGVQACQMMLADKRSGLSPDDNRSQQEIALLTESKTLDLRNAARQLSNVHEDVAFNAVGNLYTGCAAVGVRLN